MARFARTIQPYSLGHGKRDLFDWINAINEQTAALGQNSPYPIKRYAPHSRMAAV